jgi:hypothetical protein
VLLGTYTFELAVTNAIGIVSRDRVTVWVLLLSSPVVAAVGPDASTDYTGVCYIDRPCTVRWTATAFDLLTSAVGFIAVEGEGERTPQALVASALPLAPTTPAAVSVIGDGSDPYAAVYTWTPSLSRYASIADGAAHVMCASIVGAGAAPEVGLCTVS